MISASISDNLFQGRVADDAKHSSDVNVGMANYQVPEFAELARIIVELSFGNTMMDQCRIPEGVTKIPSLCDKTMHTIEFRI
ncbi:MAG: hypothetical protein ABIY50_10745 [Ignavibacteria bacterium]